MHISRLAVGGPLLFALLAFVVVFSEEAVSQNFSDDPVFETNSRVNLLIIDYPLCQAAVQSFKNCCEMIGGILEGPSKKGGYICQTGDRGGWTDEQWISFYECYNYACE